MRDGKVLITGGLGFIGKSVARLLVEQGHEVRLFDNFSPQVRGEVPHWRWTIFRIIGAWKSTGETFAIPPIGPGCCPEAPM